MLNMNTDNDLPYVDPVQAHVAHCAGCPTCDNWRELLSGRNTNNGIEIPKGCFVRFKGAEVDADHKQELERNLRKIGVFAVPRYNETHLEYLRRVEVEHPQAIDQLLNPTR